MLAPMRVPALLAVLVVVPVAALAQDAPAPRPTGSTLLDALPPEVDVVVDAPDLPGLFDSCAAAGLGDAGAWRKAFHLQLKAWGATPEDGTKLVSGGDALLAAADGEALLASLDIKMPGMSRPSERATLFAMRSTRDQKTLRAAVADLLDGGLRTHYEGEPRTEQIDGRAVLALPGNGRALYVLVQDGLLVATDHPLGIGLLSRGLARAAKSKPGSRPDAGPLKLVVRHGRGDAAWDGWMWGEGESVQWKDGAVRVARMFGRVSTSGVFVVADDKVEDLPIFPSPVRRNERGAGPPSATGTAFIGLDAGSVTSGGRDDRGEDVPGGAWRLGWLGALGVGQIPVPFSAVDPRILRGTFDAAIKTAGASWGEFIPWRSSEPGKLSGPLGHGPATLLALRCLHDISRGIPPGATEAPTSQAPARPPVPLPPPTEPKNR